MKRTISITLLIIAILLIHFQSVSRRAEELPEKEFSAEKMRLMFPGAVEITASREKEWSKVLGEDGDLLGYVVTTEGYADHITGYAGPTPILVGIDQKGAVKGVLLLKNMESPGFEDEVISGDFLEAWNGLSWHDAIDLEVDAVSGATLTSKAVVESIKHRLSLLKGEGLPGKRGFSYGDILTLILAGAALFVCLRPPKHHGSIRMAILVVSIMYLGVFRGQFLSIRLIAGWVTGGIALKATIALAVIAVLSVITLILTGKRLYCYYLCPFGALQEVIYRVSPWHKEISPKLYRTLEGIKTLLLVSVGLVLILNVAVDLTSVEPFTVFLIQSASKGVILMAAIAFIVSVFIFRPWCNFLCPTGALFSLLKKKKR